MSSITRLIAWMILVTAVSFHCNAKTISGKVVKVIDGDTFTILVEGNEQIKIRFHGIDCPEMSQSYGMVAKKFVLEHAAGEQVSIEDLGFDRYGRMIGIITLPNGKVLNEMLLEAGLAWHYKKYDDNPDWAALEIAAKGEKRGLWRDSRAIPPWEFRRRK